MPKTDQRNGKKSAKPTQPYCDQGSFESRKPESADSDPQFMLALGRKCINFAMFFISLYALSLNFPQTPLFLSQCLHGLFVGAVIHLMGTAYGIINDRLANRHCLEFYTFGNSDKKHPGIIKQGLIKSDDANSNAVASGIVATLGFSFVVGMLFTIVTVAGDAIGLSVVSNFMLPMIAACTLTCLMGAEAYARSYESKMHGMSRDKVNGIFLDKSPLQAHFLVEKSQQIYWLSCRERSRFGYMVLPKVGVVSLIANLVLRKMYVDMSALAPSLPLQFVLVGGLLTFHLLALVHYNKTHAINPKLDQQDQMQLAEREQKIEGIRGRHSNVSYRQSLVDKERSPVGKVSLKNDELSPHEMNGSPTVALHHKPKAKRGR